MDDTNEIKGSPNFTLPKEGTEERCYEEYEEKVDPKSKQLVRIGVEETKEDSQPDHKVVTREGLDFTKSLHKLNVKDFVDTVKTKISYNEEGRRKVIMKAPKTAWIHNLIHLNGDKFDFTGREYLLPIYNTNDKEILLKTARQVEKSTLLANELTVMACLIPYFRSMYVSPSHVQTRTFSNDKLKPLLERSPMISRFLQDNKVSTQVFEKGFTNGSMTFLRSAFFSADRCLAKGTLISTLSGRVPIENIEVGRIVLSYLKGKLTFGHVIGKENNGYKVVAELKFSNGSSNKATYNHKYITHRGEVLVRDLSTDDFVPIPLDFTPIAKEQYSKDFSELVGLLLSDGCLLAGKRSNDKNHYKCEFNNNDLNLVEFADRAFKSLGFKSHIRKRVTKGVNNYTACASNQAKIKKVFSPFSILGTGEFTKFIPEQFFGSRKDLSGLLRGLFEGDGWCTYNIKNRQCEVGFVSGSEKLARDVHYGLQGLGVYSVLEEKEPHGRQRSKHFCVKIRHSHYIKIFSKRVGFINKQAKLDKVVKFIDTLDPKLSRGLDIPFRKECAEALSDYGMSFHKLWQEHRISFRNNEHTKDLISLHKAKKIAEITNDSRLIKILSNDFLWVKIKSIEESKVEEVFDLEVKDSHSFMADGVVTHNSRGISADLLSIDEIQDMIADNLPVIAQCLSHSKYQYHRYAGTPKSFDNTIEQYWQNTTQNEWMVPCSGCSSATGKKWNFLDIKNVGKHGPICKFCGKRLEISDGQWQSTVKGKRMRGYRIPQLMVPWIRAWDGDPWKTLVHEMEIYPEAQFYNEILGLSYDNAAKPVTRADVAMNCSSSCHFLDIHKPIPDKYARGILFAGVDWGEGNDGTGKDIMGKKRNASYTILTIGGMVGAKFQVVYIKKYQGKEADPDFVVTDIFNTCKRLNVRMIGVDWGHGWGVNNRLFRMYGAERCVQFMYVDNQKEVRKWDPIGYKFQLMRNHVMSEVFFMFKEGQFLFPAIEEWEWYLQDIMNISVEYIEYQRKLRYIHRPSDPDDCFHSLLYCKQVADVYFGKR